MIFYPSEAHSGQWPGVLSYSIVIKKTNSYWFAITNWADDVEDGLFSSPINPAWIHL